MKDLKTFLLEEYDNDDKKSVLKDFVKYLDAQLNGQYDPKTNTYTASELWWTLGTNNGAYRDLRMTIGVKRSQRMSDEDWCTLSFYVSDDGKLTAYLDAEDYELLNNTPAYDTNSSQSKKVWSFALGVTDEQMNKAFASALGKIKEFFDNADIRQKIVKDTIGNYSTLDKKRLDMLKNANKTNDFKLRWTSEDEEQLKSLNAELKQMNKQRAFYRNALMAAKSTHDEETIDEVTTQLERIKARIDDIKIDIQDMEEDKLEYMKMFTNSSSRAERRENRAKNISILGLDHAEAANLSDEELEKMAHDALVVSATYRKQAGDYRNQFKTRGAKIAALGLEDEEAADLSDEELEKMMHSKFTKTGKLRKARSLKLGDVNDQIESEKNARNQQTKRHRMRNYVIDWNDL